MLELVAKRYTKALIKSSSKDELERYNRYFQILDKIFENSKIRLILSSIEINESKKSKLLIDILKKVEKNIDKKFENFLKLLAEKKRIYLIPIVAKELQKELSLMENRFTGTIYSESNFTKNEIARIEKMVSQKIGSSITLNQSSKLYDGIKVEVDALGIEIGFSKSKVKKDIIEHILKAI